MAENASASLPAQMQTWKETMALYRLLDEDDVTFEALMQPHWQQTREQIESQTRRAAGAGHHRSGLEPSSQNQGLGPGRQ